MCRFHFAFENAHNTKLTTHFIAIVFCYWWNRIFNQNQFNLNVGLYEKALFQFSYWQAHWIKKNVINIIFFSEYICKKSDQLIYYIVFSKETGLCSSSFQNDLFVTVDFSFYSNIILFIDVFSGVVLFYEKYNVLLILLPWKFITHFHVYDFVNDASRS